jgi:hypothetical protein
MKGRCLDKPSVPEVKIDETVTTTTTTTTTNTNRKWAIKSSDLKTNKSPLNMNLWKIIIQNQKKESENLKKICTSPSSDCAKSIKKTEIAEEKDIDDEKNKEKDNENEEKESDNENEEKESDNENEEKESDNENEEKKSDEDQN